MTTPVPDFDFYVRTIEDCVVKTLDDAVGTRPGEPDPSRYVRTVGTYEGELSPADVAKALRELTPRFPLMLVSYGTGRSVEMPATAGGFAVPLGDGRVAGPPMIQEHRCSFVVFVMDDDARGPKFQLRGSKLNPGAYKMMGDVMRNLNGVGFEVTGHPDYGRVSLSSKAFKHTDVTLLDRLPGASGYGVWFETAFKFETAEPAGRSYPVDTLVLTITDEDRGGKAGGRPGVLAEGD